MLDPFRDVMVLNDLGVWEPRPMRDWQKEDITEGRSRKKLFVLHDVGMGKTVLSARIVEDSLPALVACPSHLVLEWRDYLEAEYPEMTIRMCSGLTPDAKREALQPGADWYIINHDMMAVPRKADLSPKEIWAEKPPSKKKNFYEMPKIRSVVIDESHWPHLGRKTRTWAGAKIICDRAERVIEATATPVRKTPDGLWPQLRLLDRSFTSYWGFVHAYCKVVETPWAVKVVGARDSLGPLLQKYAIKRTYPEVGLTLPELVPLHSSVPLSDRMLVHYRRLKDDLRDERGKAVWSAGAAMPMLRRMTAQDPNKIETLRGFVGDLDSWLIFIWYHDTADFLAQELDADIVITGDVDAKKRPALAKGANKIIAGIGALAAGVDLSHHRNVFFYEEDYAPGTMKNALGRVQRWRKSGDDSPVLCRYVYAKGTIDEKIHRVSRDRGATAEELLSWELDD